MWSIIIGVVGIFATWAALISLEGRVADWRGHHYWFLGLAGLFPAWLIAFLALLPPLTRETADVPLPPRALLSSGVALFGVIATDYLLRRLQKSGRTLRPVTYWIIGWAALLPGWLIALVSF
jgi:hypothetical protein